MAVGQLVASRELPMPHCLHCSLQRNDRNLSDVRSCYTGSRRFPGTNIATVTKPKLVLMGKFRIYYLNGLLTLHFTYEFVLSPVTQRNPETSRWRILLHWRGSEIAFCHAGNAWTWSVGGFFFNSH